MYCENINYKIYRLYICILYIYVYIKTVLLSPYTNVWSNTFILCFTSLPLHSLPDFLRLDEVNKEGVTVNYKEGVTVNYKEGVTVHYKEGVTVN